MAIDDYDALKAEVQAWCGRSDSTFSNRFETFVEFAEDRMYLGFGSDEGDPLWSEPVRSAMMETSATVSLTSGVGTLPTSCLAVRRITRASDTYGLDYMTPSQLQIRLAENTGGNPGYYTVEGTTLRVAPTYTGDLTVTYYQRFDAITSTNVSGAMIIEHGDLYFAACMFEAFSFMQEVPLATAWLARYRAGVGAANSQAKDMRYAGRKLRIHAKALQ